MSLEIKFAYNCKIPQVEKVSTISVWTNYSIPRTIDELPVEFVDSDNVTSKQLKVTVPITKDPVTGKHVMLGDSSVMFEVLASVFNEEHIPVRVRAGSAQILLSDLIGKDARGFHFTYFNDWNEKGERTECGDLLVTSVKFNDVEKAAISFKNNAYSFVDENAENLSKTTTCLVARKIVNYTEEAAAKGKGMTPIRSILSLIQDPYYMTTAGVTYGPAYWVLTRPSSNNTVYYNDLIDKALFRHNRDKKWFNNVIVDQFDGIAADSHYFNDDFNIVVRIIGDALCMPSTSLPYISDTVDSNMRKMMSKKDGSSYADYDPAKIKPSESWDDAAVRNGGDCEDLARLVHCVFQGLRNGQFAENSLATSAQRVLKLYAGCGSLGSVLSPSLGNEAEQQRKAEQVNIIDSEEDKNAKVGAHMFYEMHPIFRLAEHLHKTTTDLPDDLAGEHNQPGWRNLISCLLEGTGRLDPFQLPIAAGTTSKKIEDHEYLVTKEVARRKSIRHLVENTKVTSMMQMTRAQRLLKRVPNARFGDFYMQSTSMVTLEFMDKLNMIEFMWATVGERVPEPADASPLYVEKKTTLATASKSDASLTTTEECCTEDDTDVWSGLSSHLEIPLATGSAMPAPTIISKTLHTAEHEKRSIEFLNAPFAKGIASIQKTLLAESLHTGDKSSKLGTQKIRYGIDTEDKFRLDAPAHVALLPTTSIDPVEGRTTAEMLRQLRPVALPGDFSQIEKIFDAEDKSLKALGIDTKRGEDKATDAVNELRKWTQTTMNGSAWPSHNDAERQQLSLLTFFFAKSQLRPLKDGSNLFLDSIMSEYGALKNSGVITHARIGVETPLPRRDHVVLQFMCDSKKIPQK